VNRLSSSAVLSAGLRAACVLAICAIVSASAGCGVYNKMMGGDKAAQQAAELQELQLKTMRFADEYVGGLVEGVRRFQAGTTDSSMLLAAQNWKVNQATSAYTIATGPNPVTNALDMVVLATLSRMVMEDSWVNEKYGELANPVRDEHVRLEPHAWSLADEFLTEAQMQQLHGVIDEWRQSNPHVVAVGYVHFRDFAKSIGRPKPGESGSSGSLFSFLGLDPLSNLDPAVQEIAQTRQLAERTIYYAQRAPALIDMQVERITYQLASMQETRDLLGDLDRVSKAAATASGVAAQLPDVIAREREAAIDQFMGELQSQQQETLALVTELRKALEAGTATSDSLQETLRSFDTLMGRFAKPPGSQPPKEPSRPFDIMEYATAARELAATARQLEVLVVQLEAGTPGLSQLAQRTTQDLSNLVDRAFWRLLVLIIVLVGATFLAAIGYRMLSRRLSRGEPR
jgi:hypothetical protein